jgi:hypothetical protein
LVPVGTSCCIPNFFSNYGLSHNFIVWHLHLASANYAEDIHLFTEGHQIQHHPVLVSEAQPRYDATRKMAVEDVNRSNELFLGGSKKGEKMDATSAEFKRIWPEIVEEVSDNDEYSSDEYDSDSGGDFGCC